VTQRFATNRRLAWALVAALTLGVGLGRLGPAPTAVAAPATQATDDRQAERLACQVEPITRERLVGALEAATPAPLVVFAPDEIPTGEPVDEATAEAITTTVVTSLNCRNAGDFPRVYALFSDRMIGQLFGGPETVPPEILQALGEAPQRVRPPLRVNLVEIDAISQLPDGRVSAVVVTANATHTFTDVLFFVTENDQWLIDEAVAVPDATGEATPVP
jgi:hypothetical protein